MLGRCPELSDKSTMHNLKPDEYRYRRDRLGRPVDATLRAFDYHDKLDAVTRLCDRMIEEQRAIARICEDDDMPSVGAIWRWRKDHPELDAMVEAAREAMMERIVEEMVEIADEVDPDKDEVAKAKLRIAAREKQARLLAPKRFKEAVDVTSGGEKLAPAQTAILADNRVQSLINIALQRKAKGELPPPDEEGEDLSEVMS